MKTAGMGKAFCTKDELEGDVKGQWFLFLG